MDLVAPIIPDAQKSKAPELILQGLQQGFSAMARMNEMRQQGQFEMERLAQQAEIAKDQHAIEREKLQQDGEIRKVQMDWWKSEMQRRATEAKNGLVGVMEHNQRMHELEQAARQKEESLHLNDPKFQTENPIEFAANALEFNRSYQYAASPYIKARVKDLETTIDQQKMPLKKGAATYDPDKGWQVEGTSQQVPIWQVVKDLQDPETHEQTLQLLRANGHIAEEKTTEKVPGTPTSSLWRPFDSAWDKIIGPKAGTKTTKRDRPDDIVRPWLEGKKYDFNRGSNQVPSDLMAPFRKGVSPDAGGGGQQDNIDQAAWRMNAEQGSLPAPDLPAVDPQASAGAIGQPTETDIVIQHARAAVAKGAPLQAVAQRLQEMSIDPNVLFAA